MHLDEVHVREREARALLEAVIQARNSAMSGLKAAAANNPTMREEAGQKVVSFSPAAFRSPSGRPYTVTGYINDQNLVTKVETRVEHPTVGDLPVVVETSGEAASDAPQSPAQP